MIEMDDMITKRKAEDELIEVANEFKRSKLVIDCTAKSENEQQQQQPQQQTHSQSQIDDKSSPVKSSSCSEDATGDRNDDLADDENIDEVPEEVFNEVRVEAVDKNTQIWLESKQNMRFFKEEYGVNLLRVGTPLSDTETKAEAQLDEKVSRQVDPSTDVERKAELQPDLLCFRISMDTSEMCDEEEAQWFVKQASNSLREIASQGVYVKCFWYEGPIPPGSNGAPSVSSVVKKIKGHDGKNLDRIQDRTGVIISMVLSNKAISVAQSGNADLPGRVIGVRIRCIRRRGVCEASKKIQQLLGLAGDYFMKETNVEVKEKTAIYSDSVHGSPSLPSTGAVKRNFVARSGVQGPTTISQPLYPSSEKQERKFMDGYLHREVPDSHISRRPLYREAYGEDLYKDNDDTTYLDSRNKSNLLYVYNMQGNMPVQMLKTIFQRVLCEKLALPYTCEIVLQANYVSDHSYAIVEFAAESLVTAALGLYAEDKTIFDGLKVRLPRVSIPKPARTNYYNELSTKSVDPIGFSPREERYIQKEPFPYGSRRKPEQRYIEHDYRRGKGMPWWDDETVEEPNTLYLTELTVNASAQSIRDLFEDILAHYVGTPLLSSTGRKLVLDVRYVRTKQCAFVDLATPQLVDFMLDLHSQRPELFDYMKMEIGNKYIYENREDMGRPDWVHHDIKAGRYPIKSRGNPHLERDAEPIGAYGYLERNAKRMRNFDFGEESDEYHRDKPFDFRKRPKSDPEKTVFAHGFPPSATGEMICHIFESVLRENVKGLMHDEIVTEVRVPSHYYAFVVFATEELTRLALQLYAQDKEIFDKIRLRPHIDSQMEGRFGKSFKEHDHSTRGIVRGIEFSKKEQHGLEDHPSSVGINSKSQQWIDVNSSSERLIHTSVSH
ncbi:uncharacterized protein LOC131078344 isoform X1 [Cryptomeria japonica]|uniref:uncharacterized protein LOC131078344 isoform X1 n=2 Tax=Cryptomeria japonica TaxID=3369 RepID=UPI0025AD485E|nr:uncharacterized protein LOC131078344 isoform X1 [Cryptomeria japonica]XP_057871995.1 uncharacterized protein LOC131078344 isoform X1 [Cryptomeria japonica]